MAAAVALSGGAKGPAEAATCNKTFVPASGSWNTAANWTPSGVPTSAQYACVPSGQTANVATTTTVRGAQIDGTVTVAAGQVLRLNDTAGSSASVLTGTIGSGNVSQLAGTLEVAGGSMDGAGTTTIAPGRR